MILLIISSGFLIVSNILMMFLFINNLKIFKNLNERIECLKTQCDSLHVRCNFLYTKMGTPINPDGFNQ
jgi:hypothetical protein